MSKKSKVPSEHDFARAKEDMDQRLKMGAMLKDSILSHLPQHVPCHDVWVWVNDNGCSVSYVFSTNKDLENSSGEIQRMIEGIVRNAAKGIGELDISVDYHSHEYVLQRFNGKYWQYFR